MKVPKRTSLMKKKSKEPLIKYELVQTSCINDLLLYGRIWSPHISCGQDSPIQASSSDMASSVSRQDE